MKYPNFKEEKKLHKMGCDFVIGVDEVGRGPLAGPVVACAFCITLDNQLSLRGVRCHTVPDDEAIQSKCANSRLPRSPFWLARNDTSLCFNFSKVKDSKKLSEKQREEVYKEILKCQDVVWVVSKVSEKIIDKINILNATKLAMQKAVNNLQKKMKNLVAQESSGRHFYVLVDGSMKFDDGWFGEEIKYKSIVKGDQKVLSIALASIIAKVYRDNLMKKYAKKYPQYGFEIHKGYGTKTHYENIKKFGPCKLHRKTFLSD